MSTSTTTEVSSSGELVQRHIPCEKCGSSDAKCTYQDGHGWCFACHTYFPPAHDEGEYTYEYLPWRGISKEVMSFYGCKTKVDAQGRPVAIGFKYPNGNSKIRLLEHKAFYLEKNKPIEGLFGSNKFAAGGHKTITITEGETDALTLYSVLRSPVVSVQSASSAHRDCSVARSYLNSFERIYLAFDNDAAGADAVKAVSRLFDYNKVYVLKFSNRKDANEYLQAGEDQELKNIWLNSKKYLPDTIVSSFDAFKKILEEKPKVGVPYPFSILSDMTYGIRTSETVLFTAQEKVGKTELMHFIEHHLLKETEDNVAAIYLEEPKLRHLQAIAGIELGKPLHLPDHPVQSGEVFDTIRSILGRDDRLHLYSHFGSMDGEDLLDTVRFLVSACGCKYVILDHLTMVVSGTSGSDERRDLDYISTRLEMMVKELDFALIMVSHVNDKGQTRGSRFPTKVADITVTAHRDMQHPDPVERSSIYLRVLFNRFSGTTGPAGKIIFDRDTYSFKEEAYDERHQLPFTESPSVVYGGTEGMVPSDFVGQSRRSEATFY